MVEKKRAGADDDTTAEANRRRLEEVQRFWSDTAMAEAVPLPIERSEDEELRENETSNPEEVCEHTSIHPEESPKNGSSNPKERMR